MPSRKQNSRKKRSHTSGRLRSLVPPVDVNSEDKISKFESLTMPILVFVYADWCGHCQHYKPLWKKLSQDRNRSLNMAAVRDDMVNKTSLTQRSQPISSYPTVLLIGKNGKAVNFKSGEGVESQEVPRDEETMTAIVRNAGTEAGNAALEEPAVATTAGPTISPPDISADVVRMKEEQTGGSLFDILSRTAYAAAPGVILGTAAYGMRKHRTRKNGRRKLRRK